VEGVVPFSPIKRERRREMIDRLDPGTLRALRDEAQRRAAENAVADFILRAGEWTATAVWLQSKLDALTKEPPAMDLSKPHWRCRCGAVAMPLTDGTACNCKDLYEQEWKFVYPYDPRIPPDLAGALREWRVWGDDRPISYSIDAKLAAAIDAAEKRGEL
jgi:hypothetical protein